MKKILLASLMLLTTSKIFSQTVAADTIFAVVNRGSSTNSTFANTISNKTSNFLKVNWKLDVANSTIPTGFTVNGICFLPLGICYGYSTVVAGRLDSIAPNADGFMEGQVGVGMSAVEGTSAILVVNTDLNGGKNLVFKITATYPTAVKNLEITDIKAYPNPASTNLIVEHNSSKVANAIVYNIIGRKVAEYATPVGAPSFFIPVAEFTDGMYILELKDANNRTLGVKRFSKN